MDMYEELVELINEGIDRCSRTLTLGERIAGRLIESDVTVQKWISVDERLPDKPMKYLVYTIGEKTGRFDIAYYGGYYDGFSVLYGTVTHWMPLPQPPK